MIVRIRYRLPIDWFAIGILLLAGLIRSAVWYIVPYQGVISDEGEYWGAAAWLAQGRGFSFYDHWIWTRPPMYLLFLAAHIRLFGVTAFWAPRITQTVLSVLLVYLVMRLGRHLAPPGQEQRVSRIAGFAMACSYSFATFAYLLLSETLFSVLFTLAFLALLQWSPPMDDTYRSGWRWVWRQCWLVVAGMLFGLCILTKSILTLWLACVVLWMLWKSHTQSRSSGRWWRTILPSAVLTLSVCTVVLPWSVYATKRWGQGAGIILVDTTGAYNMALAAQTAYLGHRDENVLHDQLCGGVVCNAAHAQRQQFAYTLSWTWIQQAPDQFLMKSLAELLDAVQLRTGGAERFQSGYTLGEVPLAQLVSLFLDDTLYCITVPLAVIGLIRYQGRRGKVLVGSWLMYNLGVIALLFAINRFRQPLLPFLFIYAGCAIAQRSTDWSTARRWCARLGSCIVLALILPSYLYWPPSWDADRRSVAHDTILGIQGWMQAQECIHIAAVLQAGDVAQARVLHDRANRQQPRPCLAVLQAQLLIAEGKISGADGALAFLARAAPKDNVEQAAKILMIEGDLLRNLGQRDEAKDRFVSRPVESVNDTDWAWQHLHPPPTIMIDLGAGLDYGYIRGFYKREGVAELPGNYRWSGSESTLRFPRAGTGHSQTLRLRVNGYTPNPTPTVIIPHIEQVTLAPVRLKPEWHYVEIALPATPARHDVEITFTSSVFIEGPIGLAEHLRATDRQALRLLGFQLDQALLLSNT